MSNIQIQDAIQIKNSLEKVVQTIKEDNQPLMADILTKVVIEVLHRFQQKLNVGLQDSVADLLDQFKRDVEREIFDIAQQWTLSTRQEKFLFPRNCRFVYSKGSSIVVVLEQQPGRRAITMDTGLLGCKPDDRTNRTVRKSLMFPYVLFVIQWNNGRLVNAFTAWRKSPLSKLNDPVYNPIMPNTHLNYNICTGDIVMPNGDIAHGSEAIVGDYWQSVFNTDLATFWWEKEDLPPIKDVDTWEENSDDPFLFNDLDLKSKSMTLEDMIDFCVSGEHDFTSSDLRLRLANKIEETSDRMFSKVMKYFKKKKFDRFYPKGIEDALTRSMQEILNEICDLVILLQEDVRSISERKDIDHYGWESKSPYWKSS